MKANEFGEYIRKLRKEREMIIRQLELYSGLSNTYFSQIEKGKRDIPSTYIIKKLSKCLRIDYNLLMKKSGYITEDDNVNDIDPEIRQFINDVKMWYKDQPKTKKEKLN